MPVTPPLTTQMSPNTDKVYADLPFTVLPFSSQPFTIGNTTQLSLPIEDDINRASSQCQLTL